MLKLAQVTPIMGRFLPFLILLSLIALAVYAGIQSYALIKKQPPLTTSLSLPKINFSLPKILSRPTSSPATPTPNEAGGEVEPTPTPNPGINSYLQTYLLNAASTCVHQLLGQDNSYYYLWAICKNPSASLSIPVALKLDLSSHQTPGAGESYASDLVKIFPDFIRNQEIFSDPSLIETLQSQLP